MSFQFSIFVFKDIEIQVFWNQQQKHCYYEFKMCWHMYNLLVWIYIVVQLNLL